MNNIHHTNETVFHIWWPSLHYSCTLSSAPRQDKQLTDIVNSLVETKTLIFDHRMGYLDILHAVFVQERGTLCLDFYADIFRKMKSSLHAFKILLGFMDRLNASILNFELFMHIYKILKCR